MKKIVMLGSKNFFLLVLRKLLLSVLKNSVVIISRGVFDWYV